MELKTYKHIRNYLSNHRKLAFVLSHGGLHIAVLTIIVFLLIIGIIEYNANKPNYRVFESEISLVDAPNIPCNNLRLFVSPSGKGDEYEFRIVAKYDTITDLLKRSQLPATSEQWPNSKVIWKWRNNCKTINRGNIVCDSVTIQWADSGFIVNFPNYKSFDIYSKSTSGDIIAQKGNPYLDFFFKIDVGKFELNDSLVAPSLISIDFGKQNDEIIVFESVYPTPSSIGISKIKYEGAAAVREVLENGGIYISAKNNVRAKNFDNLFLIISILGGTLIAFMLDIIITLIYKWRRLEIKQ